MRNVVVLFCFFPAHRAASGSLLVTTLQLLALHANANKPQELGLEVTLARYGCPD